MILRGRALQTGMIFCVMCAALSACGESADESFSDRSVANIAFDPDAAALIPAVSAGDDLTPVEVAIWDSAITPIADSLFADNPVTPWGNVPTSGTADYVGGVELVPDQNADDRVFGTLHASANFGAATVTGTGENFVHTATGDELTGQLALDAQFFRGNDLANEFGISGELTGTLTGTGITGDVYVEFGADFADTATVIYGGGIGTAGAADVQAAFVLSQN